MWEKKQETELSPRFLLLCTEGHTETGKLSREDQEATKGHKPRWTRLTRRNPSVTLQKACLPGHQAPTSQRNSRIPADPSRCCQWVRQREEEAKEGRKVVTGGLGRVCPVSAPADTQSPVVGETGSTCSQDDPRRSHGVGCLTPNPLDTN